MLRTPIALALIALVITTMGYAYTASAQAAGVQVEATVSGSNGMYTISLTLSNAEPFYLYYIKPVVVVCGDAQVGAVFFPMATASLAEGGAAQHQLDFMVSLNQQTTYKLYAVVDGEPVEVGEITVDNPAPTGNPLPQTIECGGQDIAELALAQVPGAKLAPAPDKVKLYQPGMQVDDEQSIPQTWQQLVEATQIDYKFLVATYVLHPKNVLVFGAGAPPKNVEVSPGEPTTLQVVGDKAILYILALDTGPGDGNTTVTGVVGPLNLTNAKDVVKTVSVVIDGEEVFSSSLSSIYEEQGMKDRGLVIAVIAGFMILLVVFVYYMNKRG